MFYKRSAGAVMNIAFRIILAVILLLSCIWLREPAFADTAPDLPEEIRGDQIPVLSLQIEDDEYPESLGKEVEKLRTFLTERQQWFNDHTDSELSKVFCEITFTADGEIIGNAQIRYQADLYDIEIPDLAAVDKEGSVVAAWVGPDGKTLDPGEKVFDDMTFTAELIPEEDAVYADGLYFESDEIWFDPDTQGPTYQIPYTTTPENANVNYVRWTSSDPDIAEVKTDGMVMLGDIGDVEITGELPSGAKASFVMHIIGE